MLSYKALNSGRGLKLDSPATAAILSECDVGGIRSMRKKVTIAILGVLDDAYQFCGDVQEFCDNTQGVL